MGHSYYLTKWKDYKPEDFASPKEFEKFQRRTGLPKQRKDGSKLVGQPVDYHEAKERWKHVNERRC